MASPYPQPQKVKELRGTLIIEPSISKSLSRLGEPGLPDLHEGCGQARMDSYHRELEHMGILATTDRALLTHYCIAWGEYDDAQRDIMKNGAIMRLENGYEQVRPIVKIRDAAEKRLFKLCVQFGFSPSARSKVKVPEKPRSATRCLPCWS